MNLIKFNSKYPSKSLNGFMDDFFTKSISEFMGADFITNIPSVNVKESDDSYIMELAAPGLEKGDFKINIENNILKISADKAVETKTDEYKFNRREFDYASFNRSFPLPETVDVNSINALYEKGILVVTLGKKEEAKPIPPKQIEIS